MNYVDANNNHDQNGRRDKSMKFSSRWLDGQVFPCRRSIGSHIGPMLINFYHSVYERLIEMKSSDCSKFWIGIEETF